ncbi:hypothetical protein IRT45_16315 [Nocardia sp. BSTN01]|uniref:hypothetical protein n=1 Tax=Nocardia sp. BSTN01 TaxID=2783665 RepID=UPI00188ECB29|nr:hypothetical protein [Nocardia sp. BSTN01]MBF4998710.1 hypothetical protein [Nocardia sp. BSTN01]
MMGLTQRPAAQLRPDLVARIGFGAARAAGEAALAEAGRRAGRIGGLVAALGPARCLVAVKRR